MNNGHKKKTCFKWSLEFYKNNWIKEGNNMMKL